MLTEIIKWAEEFVAGYRERHRTVCSWEKPLFGAAAPDDPLFYELRQRVSPTHLLPRDLLPGARSVVAYFLPFGPEIPADNAGSGPASVSWAKAYIETNRLIADLNAYLAERLGEYGFQTAVLPPTHNFDPERLVSDWSHKHVAYIAGLGRFGLNQLLITARGCCGRLGSFVTEAPAPATVGTNGKNAWPCWEGTAGSALTGVRLGRFPGMSLSLTGMPAMMCALRTRPDIPISAWRMCAGNAPAAFRAPRLIPAAARGCRLQRRKSRAWRGDGYINGR